MWSTVTLPPISHFNFTKKWDITHDIVIKVTIFYVISSENKHLNLPKDRFPFFLWLNNEAVRSFSTVACPPLPNSNWLGNLPNVMFFLCTINIKYIPNSQTCDCSAPLNFRGASLFIEECRRFREIRRCQCYCPLWMIPDLFYPIDPLVYFTPIRPQWFRLPLPH